MILVALAVSFALLVVAAGDDRNISMEPDLQVREFSDLHTDLGIGGVTDVSGLAVNIAVLDRDGEVVRQQRREDVDAVLFVRLGPFHFETADGCSVGFFLRQQPNRSQDEEQEEPCRILENVHFLMLHTGNGGTSPYR